MCWRSYCNVRLLTEQQVRLFHFLNRTKWFSAGIFAIIKPRTLNPGCFCTFNCCIRFSLRLSSCFCRFLCLLFCACSYTMFFCVSVLANYPRQFFRGGDSYRVYLPFRIITCRCLLAVVFRTWDLVCINLSFASRDYVCPRMTSICIIRFCPSAWTPRFQRAELCIASARTTLAVSAVAPS